MKQIIPNNFNDIDQFLSKQTRFAYYLPLVYQIFPQTDNQQFWGLIYYLKIFGLDKHHEPGTSCIYQLNRIFDFMYYFLLFYLPYI